MFAEFVHFLEEQGLAPLLIPNELFRDGGKESTVALFPGDHSAWFAFRAAHYPKGMVAVWAVQARGEDAKVLRVLCSGEPRLPIPAGFRVEAEPVRALTLAEVEAAIRSRIASGYTVVPLASVGPLMVAAALSQ